MLVRGHVIGKLDCKISEMENKGPSLRGGVNANVSS